MLLRMTTGWSQGRSVDATTPQWRFGGCGGEQQAVAVLAILYIVRSTQRWQKEPVAEEIERSMKIRQRSSRCEETWREVDVE
jgi:hypothetical protein